MKPSVSPPSIDERLSAWLDGELDPAAEAELQAWLRDHPDDAARARLWAADRDALRARFDPVLDEPVPDRLEQAAWRPVDARPAPGGPARWSGPGAAWRLAAVVAGAFVLGGLAGALIAGRLGGNRVDLAGGAGSGAVVGGAPLAGAPAGWVQRAAVAHSVYVPEVRHPVEVAIAGRSGDDAKAQEEHLARWLTKRLDRPVKLFDLRAQGYELVGGRLLPDAAGPSAQLMYQRIGGPADSRVTVYLRKPDAATPAAFRYEQQGPLGMFYWVDGGGSAASGPLEPGAGATGYALVGALPREKLLALAEAIYRQEPAAAGR